MHFDDFLAQQMLRANDPSSTQHGGAQLRHRRTLGYMWRRLTPRRRSHRHRRPRRDSNARPTA